MTKANKITTVAVAVLLLLLCLFLFGCNAKNIEYRRFERGELVENVRMGQVNILFWFGLNDFDVDTDKLKVKVGSMTEYPDPNSIEALTEAFKLMNRIPL